MSKSDSSDYSRINLTDGADEIALKIRKAKTDPHPLPESPDGLARRPEAENLLGMYAALAEIELKQAVALFAGSPFSRFKDALAELAVEKLAPITQEMNRLEAAPDYIDQVLREGVERARARAAPVLREVEDAIGLLEP